MTVLGMGIWYRLIGSHPVARIAPFLLLVPIISVIGGVIFLGEALHLLEAAGGTAIVAGVFLTVTSSA